jgi:hypothetical protein
MDIQSLILNLVSKIINSDKPEIVIKAIQNNPGIFAYSQKHKNIRKLLLIKTTHYFTW